MVAMAAPRAKLCINKQADTLACGEQPVIIDDRHLTPSPGVTWVSVNLSDAAEYCKSQLGLTVGAEAIRALTELGILPIFSDRGSQCVLVSDLFAIKPLLENWDPNREELLGRTLFSPGLPSQIHLSHGDSIELSFLNHGIDPAFYPGLRHLAQLSARACPGPSISSTSEAYFSSTRITTSSREVLSEARAQLQRSLSTANSRASEFAHSAHYMGSKRALGTFISEAIGGAISPSGVVLDLMCGSGAAAGVFSRRWRTLASDNQRFSQFLAEVQGGGFSREFAATVLKQVLPIARDHASELATIIRPFLEWEDRLFHTDTSIDLQYEYQEFTNAFPLYPGNQRAGSWAPAELVEKRRGTPKLRPFVLTTAYFSNIFFGLRQCLEIDSLRYAIELIRDERAQRWAMGALIATTSKLATTYAGHFAQPITHDWTIVPLARFSLLLERRTYSVFHEFSVRLLNLADESERVENTIETVPGPWRAALDVAETRLRGREVAVYFDPPYRRDEYSRYYHVLETLVTYDYPSSQGTGRTPDKKGGERASSEFSTRSGAQLVQALAQVIARVLSNGWVCAWSYSSVSDANIREVLEEVSKSLRFDAISYAAPHAHNAQGGRKPKKVTEYLIICSHAG
jgi:hypothetical protein